MASLKRIGFFWSEEKITVVEFEKNAPLQVVFSSLGSKVSSSPFSSNLTEEIQVTVILKKMLQDNHINGNSFYVSLPMKEIILRSFIIPFVKPDDLQVAIKFEAKKYIPFDIQDLSYVFHTIPLVEGQSKRLQVIFFAARKEVLARYDRVFKQVNASATYCEPYIVSLSKALLFRKEIAPTDHIAFLILEKSLGRICFIDNGIPQFIREFPIASSPQEGSNESVEELNLKIVNEVLNSFDFYSRQFSSERLGRMLISSEIVQKDLINTLETELKLKIIKFSSTINTSSLSTSSDMDAIYAMGACVTPPIESLSKFNFIADRLQKSKFENEFITAIKPYKDILFAFLTSVVFLAGVYLFFQMQLKLVQHQYDQLLTREGPDKNATQDSIQAIVQQNIDKLTQCKNVRTKSDMATIILKVASHLQVGTLLTNFTIDYPQSDAADSHANIDIKGMVVQGDFGEQIAVVNQMFADFKKDKDLSKFIDNVNLVSLNRVPYNGRQATGFDIHFS